MAKLILPLLQAVSAISAALISLSFSLSISTTLLTSSFSSSPPSLPPATPIAGRSVIRDRAQCFKTGAVDRERNEEIRSDRRC